MVSGRAVLAGVIGSAWIVFATVDALEAQTAGQQKVACGPEIVKTLAGAWKAPEYRMKRGSEVGAQVFGPNAVDVRNVDLTIEPSGEGVLKISTSVADQKGKTWAPTLIEAKVVVAAGQLSAAGKCEPAVKVTSAEERFLDSTSYRAPVDGARVILIVDPAGNSIDLRFETLKGEGSFWSTVKRPPARAARPAGQTTSVAGSDKPA